MTKRPLSHTKRGKLLAAAGGLAGGPLGVIVSPLVLMFINAIKKDGNRFLVWGLIGIISAPICWVPTIGLATLFGLHQIGQMEKHGYPNWVLDLEKELIGDPDQEIQDLRDKYLPQGASEKFIQCAYTEGISGGSRTLCYEQYWQDHPEYKKIMGNDY
tara:strand:- start:1047 stop:1520 length:474 start_codon:yes stop_codon:yes gene_type:complete